MKYNKIELNNKFIADAYKILNTVISDLSK